MKANELMIGDWVNVPKLNKPVRVGAVYRTMIMPNPDDDDVHSLIGDEYLEPIPMTEEILEKNGFTKRKDGPWAIEKKRIVGCCGQTCDNTNPLVYVIWVDKGYMGVVNYQPEATITKVGSYVHELQQCIRLCGIDKEIKIKED